MKEKVLVSACLLGINCRYDGKHAYREEIDRVVKNHYVVPACPEQLGGMTTPRSKNRIEGERVMNELGIDVTENFYRGAREFLKIAKKLGIERLILKDESPSCGKHGIVTKLLPKGLKVEYVK